MEIEFRTVIRVGLLFLIPTINVLGFVLKDIKKKKGIDIPLTAVLYVFAILVATAYGFLTSEYTGWRYFVDSIIICGLCQGIICAGISTKGYDAVMKHHRRKEVSEK